MHGAAAVHAGAVKRVEGAVVEVGIDHSDPGRGDGELPNARVRRAAGTRHREGTPVLAAYDRDQALRIQSGSL